MPAHPTIEARNDFATAAWSDAVRDLHPTRTTAPGSITTLQPLRVVDQAMGPAYTIRLQRATEPADAQRNAYLDAFDQAPPGAMVVVEVVGDVGGAVMGDLLGRRLRHIGVAGVVVEGAIRDRAAQDQVAPPVWFTRTAMNGIQSSSVRTDVGIAVQVGGVIVAPGDIVCADADGVLVAPPAQFNAARQTAEATELRELAVVSRMAAGATLRNALDSRLADS